MKALIFNPDLSFGVVPDPVPSPSQVLVQVSAVSLNFGEIAYRSPDPRPGRPAASAGTPSSSRPSRERT
ncbi:hypothetical protein [Nonomuraea recticatena]